MLRQAARSCQNHSAQSRQPTESAVHNAALFIVGLIHLEELVLISSATSAKPRFLERAEKGMNVVAGASHFEGRRAMVVEDCGHISVRLVS